MSTEELSATSPKHRRLSFNAGAFLIGLSLGGFLDGILFHQILQWHSLLSSIDRPGFGDIRFRVMTDGIFHAGMYTVAVSGMFLFWMGSRAHAGGNRHPPGAMILAGFGAWHVLDGVINHWLLGLHHIKEDQYWLFWDIVVFIAGMICVSIAIAVYRAQATVRMRDQSRSRSIITVLLATSVLGGAAAMPFGYGNNVVVAFGRGSSEVSRMAAISSVDGRLVWNDNENDLWIIEVPSKLKALKLYGKGALVLGGTLAGAGCFSTSPPSTRQPSA